MESNTTSAVDEVRFINSIFLYAHQTVTTVIERDSDNDEFAEMQTINLSKNINLLFHKRKEYAKVYITLKSSKYKDDLLEMIKLINKEIKLLLGI